MGMPKIQNDFILPSQDFDRAIDYIRTVGKIQNWLMYLFSNFSNDTFICKMVEKALESNHRLLMGKEFTVLEHYKWFKLVLDLTYRYNKKKQNDELGKQMQIGYAILTNGCKGQGMPNLKGLEII
jgi:hypothetical protein